MDSTEKIKAGKIEYLQMIQESISRMSTNAAIFKGFAATIVAGVAALSYNEINTFVLALSFIPVLTFVLLDIYYLALERKFRFLYEKVRKDEHEIDFSMKLTEDPLEKISARARIIDCIKSPSILLFYPLIIAVLVVVFLIKMKGII